MNFTLLSDILLEIYYTIHSKLTVNVVHGQYNAYGHILESLLYQIWTYKRLIVVYLIVSREAGFWGKFRPVMKPA